MSPRPNNKKEMQRQLSPTEVALRNTQIMLEEADQTKLFLVKTRFEGLLKAYSDDTEALVMLQLLMAEYALLNNIKVERGIIQ